jgi:hypothetical protein
MIAGLGLIHGFGLSTRLQELPLSKDSLFLNIISFNVGIELGQITALFVMILLIAGWRKAKSFQAFSIATNYGLMCAGMLLFLMQLHGYEHQSYPDDFGFSSDNHCHDHLEMSRDSSSPASPPTHHETID